MSKIEKKIEQHAKMNQYIFWIDWYSNEYKRSQLKNMNTVGDRRNYKKINNKEMIKLNNELRNSNNFEFIVDRLIFEYGLLYKQKSYNFVMFYEYFKQKQMASKQPDISIMTFNCTNIGCERKFATKKGLSSHGRWCKYKQ